MVEILAGNTSFCLCKLQIPAFQCVPLPSFDAVFHMNHMGCDDNGIIGDVGGVLSHCVWKKDPVAQSFPASEAIYMWIFTTELFLNLMS